MATVMEEPAPLAHPSSSSRRESRLQRAWKAARSLFPSRTTPSNQCQRSRPLPRQKNRRRHREKDLAKLFRSTSRFRNLLRYSPTVGARQTPVSDYKNIVEIELLVSNKYALSKRQYTWADLVALFRKHTCVWISRNTCIVSVYINQTAVVGYRPVLTLETLDAKGNSMGALSVWSRSVGHAAATFKILLQFCKTSHAVGVRLTGPLRQPRAVRPATTLPIAGALLADFLLHTTQNLRLLSLDTFVLQEDHCRLLAAACANNNTAAAAGEDAPPSVALELSHCSPARNAEAAFRSFLRHSRSTVSIRNCPSIELPLLCAAVKGTSRLTRLDLARGQLLLPPDFTAFCHAVKRNVGLTELVFSAECQWTSRWEKLVVAVTGHVSLQVLDLRRLGVLSYSQLMALETLLRANTALQQVHCQRAAKDNVYYQTIMIPLGQMNRLRQYQQSLAKVVESVLQTKLLAAAVYSVRHNPDLVHLLLSEHVETVCQERSTAF